MGGHNRAEARARFSGEIAGRALGGLPPLTARNGSKPYSGERDLSECGALSTPYSCSAGGHPAAQTPRTHTVERRERHCRKPTGDGGQIFKLMLLRGKSGCCGTGGPCARPDILVKKAGKNGSGPCKKINRGV